MSYKNINQQRDFQREWARNKRAKLLAANPRAANAYKYSRCVTWDQLQDQKEKYKTIEDYKECVRYAKSLLANRKVDRFKIAELCIQGSTCSHGGDRRSRDYQDEEHKTHIKNFSHDIGIHPKTLDQWVACRRLADLLPKEIPVDYSTLACVHRFYEAPKLKDPGFLLEAYLRFFNNEDGMRDYNNCIRYLGTSVHVLTRRGINGWSDDQKLEFELLLEKVKTAWERAKEISQ